MATMNREQLATALTELIDAQAEATWWAGGSVLHKRRTAKSARDRHRNDILTAFAKLEKERDDLLVACKTAIELLEPPGCTCGAYETLIPLLATALAAAKGEQP